MRCQSLVALLFLLAAGCGSRTAGRACSTTVDCDPCHACEEGGCVLDEETLNACGECEPEPEEICNDGLDNDCDTLIDEGCSRPNGCSNEGATSCADGQLSTCNVDTEGLLSWSTPDACPDGNGFCADAETCGTCTNGCASEGATSCSGGELSTCEADANGCLDWGTAATCPDGNGFCADAETCGTCTNGCASEGATSCSGGELSTCEADANGCLNWGTAASCPDGDGFCADAQTCGTCTNGCASEGATSCSGGELSTCEADANGCLDWGTAATCPDGNGFCADAQTCGTCTNGCASEGATSCSSGELSTCEADANGCLDWGTAATCPDGNGFCADAQTCGTCTNGCASEGATSCSGGELSTCEADGNGCLDWGTAATCPDGNGFCADAQTCGTCTNGCASEGATSCSGGELSTCEADANGCLDWGTVATCPDGNGFCADAETCGTCTNGCASEGATSCSGGELSTCEADANGCLDWSTPATCPDGNGFCADAQTCGTCTNGCASEGATSCSGGELSTCEADANGCLDWGSPEACADGFCDSSTACGSCNECVPLAYCTNRVFLLGSRYDTIAAAVSAAPSNATVSICPGTYEETISTDRAVNLVGEGGPDVTIIDAMGSGTTVYFGTEWAYGGSRMAYGITGLTIRGGDPHGVYMNDARVDLTVTDSIIEGNATCGLSIGAYAPSRATANLTDVEIAGNGALTDGSGLYLSSTTATGLRVTIRDNRGSNGAGTLLRNDATLTLTDSAIVSNQAQLYGGASYLYHGSTNTVLTLINVDMGTGATDNYPDDVYVTRVSYDSVPYPYLGPGEDRVCSTNAVRCTATEPSYTSTGPTDLHCAGSPAVDLNGLATYTTVAEALYRAPPNSWVSVCPGTYDENVGIGRSVHVVGVDGPAATTLRGAVGAGEPVIHLEGEQYNTTAHPRIAVDLDGLTITGGEGGGVYAHYAVTLDVNNSVLTANSGSGLASNGYINSGERNYVTLTDVELSHNVTSGDGGGLSASVADVTGTRVVISDNMASSGGGTRITNDATLTLTDGSIVSNQAQFDGGASFLSGWGDTTLITTNVDMGIGTTDNDPEDVYVTSTGSDPVPYPYFGPGEDQVCSATTVRCTPTEPSYTSAGPTGLHCAGAPSVDLNGLATYATIAEAVYRAPPNSWVSVCPGTYDENVTIVRSVQVVGVDGPSTTILRGVTGAGESVIHLEGERYNTTAHPRIAVDLDGLTITGGEGGGVYAHYAVTLDVNNSILTANSGSGLASNGYINSGERNYVTLTDVELSHNVTSGDGGGLYLSTADATGTRVTISDNTALSGGGIGLINNAPIAELVDSAILRNTGTNQGGGVMLRLFSDAELTLTNSDLGSGADDNGPDDIYIDADSGSDPVYTSYGAGVSVSCQQQVAGCTP